MQPLIHILMAVYHPNPVFFEEQLESLGAQTHRPLALMIRIDQIEPEMKTFVCELAKKHVPYPFTVLQNEKNVGSVATFERMTREANGDFFAYCDQDDVWHPDKIEKTFQAIQDAPLAYSNLRLIDGEGREIASTLQHYRRRYRHLSGGNLTPFFLWRNCVTGCALLIRADIARAAMPFPAEYVHDHWLALVASTVGEIRYVGEPLIDYRLHGNNQIGLAPLSGVVDKASYAKKRLGDEKQRLLVAKARFHESASSGEIDRQLANLSIREALFQKPSFSRFFRALAVLWPRLIPHGLMELVIAISSQKAAVWILQKAKK